MPPIVVAYSPSTSYEADLVAAALRKLNAAIDDTTASPILTWAKSADVHWPSVFDNDTCATSYYLRTSLTRKAELAALAKRPNNEHAASLAHLLPETHILDADADSDDDDAVFDSLSSGSPSTFIATDVSNTKQQAAWILKPSEGNRGRGLAIATDLAHLRSARQKEVAYVLQRYVHSPLLIDNRKFHVRLHVLCVGDARVLVHGHAVALISGATYNPSDLSNRTAHVTNHCVQEQSQKHIHSTIELGLPEACAALHTEHADLRAAFPDGPGALHAYLHSALADAARGIFGAALAGPPLGFFPLAGSSELFGVDVLLARDDDTRPISLHLLEVNADPSMAVFGSRDDMRTRCADMLLDVARAALAEAAAHRRNDAAIDELARAESNLPPSKFVEVLSHRRPPEAVARRVRALRRLMTGLNAAREDTDSDGDRYEGRALVNPRAPGGQEVADALRSAHFRVSDATSHALKERMAESNTRLVLYGVARSDVDWARVLDDGSPILASALFRGDVLFSPARLQAPGAPTALEATAALASDPSERPGMWRVLRPATDAAPMALEDRPRPFAKVVARLRRLVPDGCVDDAAATRAQLRALEALEVVQAVPEEEGERVRLLVLIASRPARCYVHEHPLGGEASQDFADACARAVAHAMGDDRPSKARVLALPNTFEVVWAIAVRTTLVRFEPLAAHPLAQSHASAIGASVIAHALADGGAPPAGFVRGCCN